MPDLQVSGRLETPGRAFPWFCPKCHIKEVRPAIIAYQTERLYDGRLVAVSIPHLNVPQCANCGELVFNYAADEQILDAVRAQAVAAQPAV